MLFVIIKFKIFFRNGTQGSLMVYYSLNSLSLEDLSQLKNESIFIYFTKSIAGKIFDSTMHVNATTLQASSAEVWVCNMSKFSLRVVSDEVLVIDYNYYYFVSALWYKFRFYSFLTIIVNCLDLCKVMLAWILLSCIWLQCHLSWLFDVREWNHVWRFIQWVQSHHIPKKHDIC